MRLTDIFTGEKPIKESGKTPRSDSARAAMVSRQIRSMVPGQTISGELVAKNGGELQLKLGDDVFLNARLEQNMNLELGKMMTFEVRNNGKSLTLSPLFANMATDANTLKALDMASLPVNEATVEMTSRMMDAGMSVDKNSLQQMYREINAFPEAEIADIIDLHRLGLPVDEENLGQIAAYRNLTHQIGAGIEEIAEELPELLERMVQGGDAEEAAKLILDLAAAGQDVTKKAGDGEAAAETTETLPEEMPRIAEETGQSVEEADAQDVQPSKVMIREEELPRKDIADTKDFREPVRQEALDRSTPADLQELFKSVKEMAGRDKAVSDEKKSSELWDQTTQLLEKALKGHDTDTIKKLLSDSGIKNLMKENLERDWTLKPEDVADKSKVEDLYRRLTRQLKGMTQSLEDAGQTDSHAYKTVSNMTQNVDFLHQLNQAYAYVQLPIRLTQGDAHGDLYVYTNKKHLAAEDGKISALLHLDMKHLGPVDVYVAMENSKVSTNFYVKDDAMLDFLGEHMDILTERLKGRGYHCDCSLTVRGEGDKKEGGINSILDNDKSHVPLAQYAFDVRA